MIKFYSQYNQDKWLYENIFKDFKNGIFLEIGALDGIKFSNTFLFEQLGWKGICVEPNPYSFEKLKQNRNCIIENFALSDEEGEIDFLAIKGYGDGLSGIIENYNDNHKNRVETEIKNKKNEGNEIVKVNTITFSNILKKHGINTVDFCSIDTEGSELKILKGLDFKVYQINYFLIENNYKEKNIEDFLNQHGYKKIHTIGVDEIYKLIL